jgi:SAM-dependent methyltransferase
LVNDPAVRQWFSLLRQEKLCGGRKFLDVGCGRGLFVAVACEFGWEVHGFDVTDANRAEIESQCGIHIEVGKSPLERFGEAAFDALFCNQVLEHTQQPVAFMDELRELLKPGGTLFLSFPNENALMHVYERIVKRLLGRPPLTQQPLQSPYHILGFTQKAFDRLIQMGGWEVRWLRKCWGVDIFLRDTYQKPYSLRARLYDRALYLMAILGHKLSMGRYFQAVLRKPWDS